MAEYATKTDLKAIRIPQIPAPNTDHDTELDNCCKRARVQFVDPALGRFEDTLPLTTCPDAIKEITADIGAGIYMTDHHYQMEAEMVAQQNPLMKRGLDALDRYIEDTYTETGRTTRAVSAWRRSSS